MKTIELLGLKVKDVVTGFTGIVTTVSFDLYGCVQAIVDPGVDKDQKPMDRMWFDTKRLEVLNQVPVMAVPDFLVVPGGQSLPIHPSNPI